MPRRPALSGAPSGEAPGAGLRRRYRCGRSDRGAGRREGRARVPLGGRPRSAARPWRRRRPPGPTSSRVNTRSRRAPPPPARHRPAGPPLPAPVTAHRVLLPQGDQRVPLEARGSHRLSPQTLLDFRMSRDACGDAGRLLLLLDMLNFLDDNAEEGLVTDIFFISNFGRPAAFLDPPPRDAGRTSCCSGHERRGASRGNPSPAVVVGARSHPSDTDRIACRSPTRARGAQTASRRAAGSPRPHRRRSRPDRARIVCA